MDVVERVHEEMWVDLILQILQLLFEILLLKAQQLLLVVTVFEIKFHAQIHATHEDGDDDGNDVVFGYEDRRTVGTMRTELRLFIKRWGLVVEGVVQRSSLVILHESCIMHLHGFITVFLHHVLLAHLHAMDAACATELIRALLALIEGKQTYQTEREQPIEPALVAMDE